MPNIGPMEILLVAIIALVVLGPKKLPEAGRSLGHGIRELKSSLSGEDTHARTEARDEVPAERV